VGGAAYRNRTDDLRITRGMLPRCTTATCTTATCINSTKDTPGSADYTGISRPFGPRTGPRQRRSLATARQGLLSGPGAVRAPERIPPYCSSLQVP
jgi:hypothetical protein